MNKKWKVLYYVNENGESPVYDYLNRIDLKSKIKFTAIIDYLQEMGITLPRPYADYLNDGIYELRIKLLGLQTRTLYFFCYDNYIILTHTFIKNENKVPTTEINKAKKIRENFLKRYNKDNIKDLII